MKKTKVLNLGTINLNGKVYAIDPCYSIDTWCMALIKNIKKGKYHCFATQSDEGDWGKRISELTIVHDEHKESIDSLMWEMTDFSIGVDSGQAGFFDEKYYEKYHKGADVDDNAEDSQWYNRVCNITLNGDWCGTIDDKGVVSESGYGDGGYDVFAVYDDDSIVALKIVFISDWEDEDDEEN